MARILLGVSGGIAAYKAVEFTRLAIKAGHAVRVIQTPTSERFVGKATFEGITGAPALISEFEPDPARGSYPGEALPDRVPISHLALVERAEILLVAPASANTLAKLAHGLADNLLSTAALAASCPVAVAPAMNNRMYTHPATQANLETLKGRGVAVIDPGEGELASQGEYGIGRLAEPAALLEECERLLTPAVLDGLKVLVTAGGTREPIDSVRYIGNRSSGRMGIALAAEAARRGAEVTLVAAHTSIGAPHTVKVIDVTTAAELASATERQFEHSEVLLMAAAVADFRPASPAITKLKKDEGTPTIELEPTADVLSTLSQRRRPGQVIVGFAAEHGGSALDYGREKLARKRLDAIVVNDISGTGTGFDSEENEVTIITATGDRHIERTSKQLVAAAVLDEVELLLSGRGESGGARADARSATRV